jgi:hypothetical protein
MSSGWADGVIAGRRGVAAETFAGSPSRRRCAE